MDYDRIIIEMLNRISILEEKVALLSENTLARQKTNLNERQIFARKYRLLADYLHNSDKKVITLSFEEIEKILSFELPKSAIHHRAFWANTTTHSIALSWLNVGYEVADVDLDNKCITFEKRRGY